MEKIRIYISKTNNILWKFWEKKKILVNFLLSCILITLYYFGFMPQIRESSGSLIAYAVGILTVEGVFLTLLITLKSSPVMARLKSLFPNLHDHLYKELRFQIAGCLLYILLNSAISIAGPVSNKYLICVGIISWSYLTISITIGILYSLKTVMNLAVGEIDSRRKMS